MAYEKISKTEADLIRKVRLIDETMTALNSSYSDIRFAMDQNTLCLGKILEQLQILNIYMSEVVGDVIKDTK